MLESKKSKHCHKSAVKYFQILRVLSKNYNFNFLNDLQRKFVFNFLNDLQRKFAFLISLMIYSEKLDFFFRKKKIQIDNP